MYLWSRESSTKSSYRLRVHFPGSRFYALSSLKNDDLLNALVHFFQFGFNYLIFTLETSHAWYGSNKDEFSDRFFVGFFLCYILLIESFGTSLYWTFFYWNFQLGLFKQYIWYGKPGCYFPRFLFCSSYSIGTLPIALFRTMSMRCRTIFPTNFNADIDQLLSRIDPSG